MTVFLPAFHPNPASLTELQKVIIQRGMGTIKHFTYGSPEITGTIESITDAVESAYILTPKADLPKVTNSPSTATKRQFYFAGDPFVPCSTDLHYTSEQARKSAAKWLAVAQFLGAEEKAKATDEAKAKAASAMAEAARKKRLDELADEWFGKDYFDLGPNKASAVKEIYRLETIIAEEDAA